MENIGDYESINSVNVLYLIVGIADGYIIENIKKNKYLGLASTDRNKEGLAKYTESWDKIKSLINSRW